jgi:hypothetical protein
MAYAIAGRRPKDPRMGAKQARNHPWRRRVLSEIQKACNQFWRRPANLKLLLNTNLVNHDQEVNNFLTTFY